MNKIASTGLKLDLHIHSCYSSNKDGKKVKNNTKENVTTLIQKLNENGVNICAITDHDIFSYDMYHELKKAELEDNSIKKVLPGIEFSINFKNDEDNKVIHVIAIFSDKNDDKIKNIEDIMSENRPDESTKAYNENIFLDILRQIDIDTILIAHQKNSLYSSKARANDANGLGTKKFLEFIYSDYFEAFEFKNKRNEVLNKTFLITNDVDKNVSFVTGTDCHDWTVYPQETNSDNCSTFPYTYAKCLPTFKGLVMAFTDTTRLKREVNSFFSADNKYINEINLCINGQDLTVPMSRGINAIIGDNSVGKSMLLHVLTDYSKGISSRIKKGYKEYLNENNVKIYDKIPKDYVFAFDMQGEIRTKFEENKIKADEFLKNYFPERVDSKPYKDIIENEINKMISYLNEKFDIDRKINSLVEFKIEIIDESAESLTFEKNLRRTKKRTNKLDKIDDSIRTNIINLEELIKLPIEDEDKEYIKSFISHLKNIKNKYSSQKSEILRINERIEKISNVIDKVSAEHGKTISDTQKRSERFSNSTDLLLESITEIIKRLHCLSIYSPNIKDEIIDAKVNHIFKYDFVSKLNINEINNEYFENLISKALKKNAELHWDTITEEQLKDAVKYCDEDMIVTDYFKQQLMAFVDKDLEPKYAIVENGEDKFKELSSGFNSKIYFDLISHEHNRAGIYLIDQPEDNVSQTAIREYLLDYFKSMSEIRQIILVTHNPQFIVNLDVDNLIYISNSDDSWKIQSGSLEYECDDYNVLDIVANNIDGGLSSIKKRWKRYEKTVNI